MIFTNQNRYCHAERSEASRGPSSETLRCAQGDTTLPILNVKFHYNLIRKYAKLVSGTRRKGDVATSYP